MRTGAGHLSDMEHIKVTVTDNEGSSSSSTLLIQVTPANDPPAVTVPGAHFDEVLSTPDGLTRRIVHVSTLAAVEDVPRPVPDVRIRDVDATESFGAVATGASSPATAGLVEVSLFATNGTLSINPASPVALYTAGDGTKDQSLSFRATVANANEALKTLVYQVSQ